MAETPDVQPLHVPPARSMSEGLTRELLAVHTEVRDARAEAATASSKVDTLKGRLLGFEENDRGELGDLRAEVRGIRSQLWWLIGVVLAALVTALVDLLSRLPHGV